MGPVEQTDGARRPCLSSLAGNRIGRIIRATNGTQGVGAEGIGDVA